MALQPQFKNFMPCNKPERLDRQGETYTDEQENSFSGSVCNKSITLPDADFDAFVKVVNSNEEPNEKLRNGAEWFKQNGY